MSARRAVMGSAVMTGGHAVRVALQMLLLPFLAVRLGPDAYGLVALAMPVVFLAILLGNGGLGAGLVRRAGQAAADNAESTVFWFSLALGGALAAFMVLLAGPIAWLLGEPAVAPLLRGISPIVILSSLCTVPQARLTTRGALLTFAASDLAAALGGMVAAFLGAWNGWGAWSLVAQQVVLWAIKFAIVFWASRMRLRFVLVLDELRGLLGFGMNLVVGNLVEFCTRSADVYVINLSSGVRDLGFYAIAMQVVRLPDMVLTGPVFTALFPILAAASHEPARMARSYLAGLRAAALVAFPTLVGLGVVAPVLVAAVLGERWALTGTLLAILVPVGLAKCLYPVSAALFLGAGRSDLSLRLQVAVAVASVLGIAGGMAFGVLGVAIGYAVVSAATIPLAYALAVRVLGVPARPIAAAFVAPVLATAVMAAAVTAMIGVLRAEIAATPLLILAVAAGVVVYAAALALVSGHRLRADLALLRGVETGA